MMLYFEICKASYGAISWAYLEDLPVVKLQIIARAAKAFNLADRLSNIQSVNLGFAGDNKKIDQIREDYKKLMYEKPKIETTSRPLLDKWKKITRGKEKKALARRRGREGKKKR